MQTSTSKRLITIIIIGGLFASLSCNLVGRSETIKEFEVGIILEGYVVKDVVGPGTCRLGLFEELKRISCEAIPFSLPEAKITTQDEQVIELSVEGDILRSCSDTQFLKESWAFNQDIFLDDKRAQDRIAEIVHQAIKMCGRNASFENEVETAVSDFQSCTETEAEILADHFGLRIENMQISLR